MAQNPFLKSLKTSIEFCGKHPFATGIIAILGIAGLVLSIVGFSLDRQDAADTTEQIADLRKDVVKENVLPWQALRLTNAPLDYTRKGDVTFCSARTNGFVEQAGAFIDFVMQNQGATVFLDFGVNLEECRIYEEISEPAGSALRQTLQVGHYSDFSSVVYAYKHPGLDPAYIEKSRDIYSPAFVLYFERFDTDRRKADQYIATFWPPLSQLRSYSYGADEYGLNLVSGLFKITLSSASGGYGIELLPVEAIDFARYERTLAAVRDRQTQ
ncbi:MAG: hypothetical protein AAFV19_23690 [Pseudomonadota bacterium]